MQTWFLVDTANHRQRLPCCLDGVGAPQTLLGILQTGQIRHDRLDLLFRNRSLVNGAHLLDFGFPRRPDHGRLRQHHCGRVVHQAVRNDNIRSRTIRKHAIACREKHVDRFENQHVLCLNSNGRRRESRKRQYGTRSLYIKARNSPRRGCRRGWSALRRLFPARAEEPASFRSDAT